MFRKIVSHLSFSPALVGQLSFYAKRLRKEEATRKLGLIFVALALVVQSLAVFAPPTSANAADANDLVYGGIRPADGGISIFLRNYDGNVNGLRDIMTYFGVTRDEIAGSQHGEFTNTSEIHSLYSVNHRQQGEAGEQALNTTNTSTNTNMTFFTRPLYRSDNRVTVFWGFKGYSAELAAKTGNGTFYLMDICGNMLVHSIPAPPKPKCTVAGKTDLYADDSNCFVNCTFPGKTTIPSTSPQCFANCTITGKTSLAATDSNCKITPCPYPGLSGLAKDSKLCVPPTPANLVYSKTAQNASQGNVDATTVVAKAGDQIRFTLTAKNAGGTDSTQTISDDLTDTLQYATLTDAAGGTFDDKTQTLSWPNVTIAKGDSISRTILVQLKDPIPATPTGLSDETSYDCMISNIFGNRVDIKVDCPAPKVVEQTVTQLPHTGPTENILFSGIVLAIVAFFYLRSRQLGKEVHLIRRDLNAGAI